MSSTTADLLPQARIRQAALELWGAQGFERTTIRQIASRAEVSPALVLHHFGSKQGLRDAVDAWVLEVLASEKALMIVGAAMPSMSSYLDSMPEYRPILDYITQCLRAGGESAERMFDQIRRVTVDIVETSRAQGVEFDLGSDPDAGITILVAMSLGFAMLERPLAHHLGGDSLTDPAVLARYSLSSLEILTHGIFTDDSMLEAMRASTRSDQEE